VYGDVLTDLDLGALLAFHRSKGAVPHVTLSLNHAPNPWECGIVAVDGSGRVTRFVEKPPKTDIFSDLTNAGVLVVDRPILDYIPAGQFSDISRDLLPVLLKEGVPIFAQTIQETEYLIDMGTPDKYERAQKEWPTAAAAQ
jgi:mannose-1-phosphate guanylyltransferase/phosphomannomutase